MVACGRILDAMARVGSAEELRNRQYIGGEGKLLAEHRREVRAVHNRKVQARALARKRDNEKAKAATSRRQGRNKSFDNRSPQQKSEEFLMDREFRSIVLSERQQVRP